MHVGFYALQNTLWWEIKNLFHLFLLLNKTCFSVKLLVTLLPPQEMMFLPPQEMMNASCAEGNFSITFQYCLPVWLSALSAPFFLCSSSPFSELESSWTSALSDYPCSLLSLKEHTVGVGAQGWISMARGVQWWQGWLLFQLLCLLTASGLMLFETTV